MKLHLTNYEEIKDCMKHHRQFREYLWPFEDRQGLIDLFADEGTGAALAVRHNADIIGIRHDNIVEILWDKENVPPVGFVR